MPPVNPSNPESPPRVLFFNRSYWPDAEATGQLLSELCADLAPRFAVTVVAGQPNHNAEQAAFVEHGRQRHAGVVIERVRHTRFDKSSLMGRAANMVSYLAAATWAGLRQPRPAVVVMETDPPLLCLLGAVLQIWFRARLVVYLQDIYPDVAVALGKLRRGWFTALLRRMFFTVYRRADRVVVLSRDMRELLLEAGVAAEKVVVIPNWIDTTAVYPLKAPHENPFREQHGLQDRFVVMYSGNLGLSQRLETVLLAAERLRERREIVWLMIGEGASKPQLQALARARGLENVWFLPYQPKAELAASLSAADVQIVTLDPRLRQLLMPSKVYGVLAAGTASLMLTAVEGELADLAQVHETGWVVPPDDPAALAEAIAWAVEHPAELAAMGRRARALAVARFDRRQSTTAFADLLSKLVGKASPRPAVILHPELRPAGALASASLETYELKPGAARPPTRSW